MKNLRNYLKEDVFDPMVKMDITDWPFFDTIFKVKSARLYKNTLTIDTNHKVINIDDKNFDSFMDMVVINGVKEIKTSGLVLNFENNDVDFKNINFILEDILHTAGNHSTVSNFKVHCRNTLFIDNQPKFTNCYFDVDYVVVEKSWPVCVNCETETPKCIEINCKDNKLFNNMFKKLEKIFDDGEGELNKTMNNYIKTTKCPYKSFDELAIYRDSWGPENTAIVYSKKREIYFNEGVNVLKTKYIDGCYLSLVEF